MKTNENKKQNTEKLNTIDMHERLRNAMQFISNAEHELMRMNVYLSDKELTDKIASINHDLDEQRVHIDRLFLKVQKTIEVEAE